MGTRAPIAIWLCLLLACIWCLARPGVAQLDVSNVEGPVLPEVMPGSTADYFQPDDGADQDKQQLSVVAVDGVPVPATEQLKIANSSTAVASQGPRPGQAATDSTTESPTGASIEAVGRQGPLADATVANTSPAYAETQLPAIQPADVTVSAATAPAEANPAATAFTALAVPRMGAASAGSIVPGRYVVIFSDNVTTVDHGIERLQRHVRSKLSQLNSDPSSAAVGVASVAVAAAPSPSNDPPFRIRATLGMDSGPQAPASVSVASVAVASASNSGGSNRSRVRGIVVEAPAGVRSRALYRALKTSGDVSKVIQDRVISISQDRCTPAKSLSSVAATAPSLRWAGCKMSGAKIYWFGERCGANLAKTRWLGMYALNTTTNQMIPGCLQYRKSAGSDPWNTAHMGQCGVAPTAAPSLPISVCPDSDASGCVPPAKLTMLRLTLNKPITCNSGSSTQLVLQGSRCGPGLGFVQWASIMMPDGAGCSFSRSPADSKFNNDWLGSCGVTPNNLPLPGVVCTSSQAAAGVNELSSGAFAAVVAPPSPIQRRPPPSPRPSPSPPPPPPPPPPSPPPPRPSPSPTTSPTPAANSVPAESLAANEFVPGGIQRVQAVYNGRVPDLDNAPVKGIVVAVVDTGVDASHPDLNVVGGANMVADEPDMTYADDSHGHGTHVSGTIGARNQGKGIVGIAPGIGIYALRVLKADGNGLFSDLLRAYDHLVNNGRSLGVRVVNLSLSGSGNGNDEECGYIAQLIAQGMTVVTAAGNSGTSMLTEVPAACPGALAVTAISDTDGVPGSTDDAASWSNYLPMPDANGTSSRVIAAPGDAITSTYPLNKSGFNSYAKMSGTSMACPHVSGIVALCYSAGICQRNTGTELAKVVNAVATWNTENPVYRYNSDPLTNPPADKYYGYMAWSRKYWGRSTADN